MKLSPLDIKKQEFGKKFKGFSPDEVNSFLDMIADEMEDLLKKIWGYENCPTTRTIDNHILKLRKKIESEPNRPAHLLTVYGVGYRFVIG